MRFALIFLLFFTSVGLTQTTTTTFNSSHNFERVYEEESKSNFIEMKKMKPDTRIFQHTQGVPCRMIEFDKNANVLAVYTGHHEIIELVLVDRNNRKYLLIFKIPHNANNLNNPFLPIPK